MLDLFAIAKPNAIAVETAFERVVTALPPEEAASVREFAAWVEAEALIAINVRLLVVVELLNGGCYQNVYEWAQDRSRLCGRPTEDVLRECLGEYYDRRITFDRAFKNGESFRYGALNAGGVGLTRFAPYCVVLSRGFQDSLAEIACLPGDTLKMFFAADGSFDETAVERSATPHTHRHLMVATKRGNEIHQTSKPQWPGLVASENRFFEAVFVGEISLHAVHCVRVPKTEYDRWSDLAFANFGRKLGEAERAFVQDFIQLRRAEVEGRIQVEVLR